MTIRIELDSVPKYRNTKEWRPVNRARAKFGGKIRLLCRDLLGDFPQISEQVEVWRCGTLCFAEMPIKSWPEGKALRGEQPEHLRRQAGN